MHLSESQAKSYNSNHYKHSTQRKISEMNQYFLQKKKKVVTLHTSFLYQTHGTC
jgi:hypothetical protein